MAKLLKLRRGTDTQHSTFTGAEGEVTVNTTNDSLHVHDGTTAGGTELAKADLSNVDGSLSNNLGFADGTKALFGTGNDLEIYHNGSDSVISDLGTGDLYIKSSSTFIRTGTNESMANFNADGSVQLYHDNSQKLATTSTGINVTGTVTCDGLTSDGEVTVQSSAGVLSLKDTDSSGNATNNYIQGQNTNGANRWRVGQTTTGNENLYIQNFANTPIVFSTNGSNRVVIQSDGHLVPNDDDSYDLGTSSAQWRDGWFDGTVNCDGLVCTGDAQIESTEGILTLKDTNNTGASNVNYLRGRDSNNTTRWYLGHASNADQNLYVSNQAAASLVFETNGNTRCVLDSSGHVHPAANNTYDLGTASDQWRNAYFDGTVTTDNLTVDSTSTFSGDATFSGGAGAVSISSNSDIRFVDSPAWTGNTGSNAKIQQHGGYLYIVGGSNGIIFREDGTDRCRVDADGHFRPATNNTYDLGTSANRWRNVYTNDLNLSNEGGSNDVDGTWGSWTIQEGEDDLFLLNRRNGKKYKFNLSEVN